MKTLASLGVVLATAVALLTGPGVGSSYAADTTLSIDFLGERALVNMHNDSLSQTGYIVDSSDHGAQDVTVDFTVDAGMSVNQSHVTLGDQTGHQVEREVQFTASPGLHTVTATVSASNAATITHTFPVWGENGAAPSPSSSVGRRGYLVQTHDERPSGTSHVIWSVHWFINRHQTLERTRTDQTPIRSAGGALPKRCTKVDSTCGSYAYDASTRMWQFDGFRGYITRSTLSLDNVIFDARLTTPQPGARIAFVGTQHYSDGDGAQAWRITLRHDGTYRRDVTGGRTSLHERGRYLVGSRGALTLRPTHGKPVHTSLALLTDGEGHPQVARRGLVVGGIPYQPRQD